MIFLTLIDLLKPRLILRVNTVLGYSLAFQHIYSLSISNYMIFHAYQSIYTRYSQFQSYTKNRILFLFISVTVYYHLPLIHKCVPDTSYVLSINYGTISDSYYVHYTIKYTLIVMGKLPKACNHNSLILLQKNYSFFYQITVHDNVIGYTIYSLITPTLWPQCHFSFANIGKGITKSLLYKLYKIGDLIIIFLLRFSLIYCLSTITIYKLRTIYEYYTEVYITNMLNIFLDKSIWLYNTRWDIYFYYNNRWIQKIAIFWEYNTKAVTEQHLCYLSYSNESLAESLLNLTYIIYTYLNVVDGSMHTMHTILLYMETSYAELKEGKNKTHNTEYEHNITIIKREYKPTIKTIKTKTYLNFKYYIYEKYSTCIKMTTRILLTTSIIYQLTGRLYLSNIIHKY